MHHPTYFKLISSSRGHDADRDSDQSVADRDLQLPYRRIVERLAAPVARACIARRRSPTACAIRASRADRR
jgi:hypothetical protein